MQQKEKIPSWALRQLAPTIRHILMDGGNIQEWWSATKKWIRKSSFIAVFMTICTAASAQSFIAHYDHMGVSRDKSVSAVETAVAINSDIFLLIPMNDQDPITKMKVKNLIQYGPEFAATLSSPDIKGEWTIMGNEHNLLMVDPWQGRTLLWLQEDQIEVTDDAVGQWEQEECPLDFGPTSDGLWIQIYDTHVDVSKPGKEVFKSFRVDQIELDGGIVKALQLTACSKCPDDEPIMEVIAFGGKFPSVVPE